MVRRSLGVALWTIVGLLACFLGALSALVGTGAGRSLLARVAETSLNHVFTGAIEIGDVRGSLLTGVTLTEVRLFDADTTLVAWLPRADLAYNPLDFAAGRVVFFEFALRQPVINLVQHRSGRLNIEELLRLGGPDTGPHGPATLILFRNVRIEDGTVTLRLQAARAEPGDTALEIEGGGPNGRLRIRRFEHLDARLAALQVSSPAERGIRIDVSRLAVVSSDPAARLVDVSGRLRVIGDSLELDLARARLPHSDLRAARGRVTWPRGPLLFNLSLRADSARLGDFHFIDKRFAPDAELVGGVRLRSHGARVLEIGLDPLRLSRGGGTVTVEAAALDLGTVQRLVPAVALHGVLYADGSLSGPLKNAQFVGRLEYRDGARPPSKLTGTVRLDGRTDTLGVYADVTADSLSFDGFKGSFPALPLRGAVAGSVKLSGPLAALETHAELHSDGGAAQGDGVLLLGPARYGARDFTLRASDVDLARWLDRAPPSRLTFRVAGGVARDDTAPPVGRLSARLAPSLFAGTPIDSGIADVRFADRHVHVDSLRITQPGLTTTGAGALGWSREDRGSLALTLDADSLNSLDSLLSWAAGSIAADGEPGVRPLAGAARALVTLEGSLDSLGLDARASGERLRWRHWAVPRSGRARLVYRPGPVPRFELEATLDSLNSGALGFGAAAGSAQGTRDSLTWFARSRVGEGAAFLAGGRFARRGGTGPTPDSGSVVALGLDSLAVQLPGDVWVLERPTELTVTDSAASTRGLALKSAYGPGRLVLGGDLPTRGRADAHLQLESFPLAGVYALLERDTAGVGGMITATAGLSGTRADPVSNGTFSLTNGSLGEFRAPFVDGTFEYRARRLDAALHLTRSGQQILTVQAHLPLDLSLVPVERRQLPDTLSVRATADSVDLSVLEALTPALRQVQGVFSADLGIAGTWDAPRLRGALQIAGAAATIPALNVRYADLNGRLALSGDSIVLQSLSARSDRGRADVSGVVRLEQLTHPALDLRIAADQFKALDLRNNVTITASGQLALRGPVFGASLTGRANVTSGVLYFADLVQKRIVNLDELADTSLAAIIEQQRLGPEFQSVFLDSLRIQDLQLEMGSDVWLRSNEANIQLTGTVSLTKQRNLYLVSGTLQAARGTYRLKLGPVTREFVVSQGTVHYFGTPDQDAGLDIEARHVVHPVPTPAQRNPDDITVVAHITGTLLVPRVTLQADKRDLSQTEIISYLLFGKSSLDLGGEQGGIADQRALLQSALSVLSGEIEQTIVSGGVPVDYVEIRPSGGGQGAPLLGWQFAVGRQLGPKTFLVLNAGFCEGRQVGVRNTLGLSLQFRISPEWRTEASFEPVQTCADPSTESQGGTVPRQVGLDLFWEKRY